MVSLNAGNLTVQYSKNNDRLAHSIGVQTEQGFVPILDSVEGSSQDNWPVSPPMQQVVSEPIGGQTGDQPVLLGVGLSGNGHWSIAVDAMTEQDLARLDENANDNKVTDGRPADHDRGLRFDVACKTSKPATFLGSTYRLAAKWQIVSIDDHSARLNSTDGSVVPCTIAIRATHGVLKYQPEVGLLSFLPSTSPSQTTTHRWCHLVSIVSQPV